MFIHHLRIAFRNLRKYKSQTLIGVLGLTTACVVFAIGCHFISIYLSKNTSFPNHERMYDIKTRSYQSIRGDMKQTLGEWSGVEKYTAFRRNPLFYGHLLTEGNESDRLVKLRLLEADTGFWDFFSLKSLTGNVQSILNTPNSIVLYEAAAKKIGVIDSLQGRTILINDIAHTITGILKNPPVNSTYFRDDGLVFNQENGYFRKNPDMWNPMTGASVIVMLTKGISPEIFQKTLDSYPFAFDAGSNSGYKEQVYIASISEIKQEEKLMLTILFVVVLLVLFVALFNIISFQSAQFYNRLKECAVRKVNGSGKGPLLLSFYMEIFILFVLSFMLGLLLIDFLKLVIQQPGFAELFQSDMVSGLGKHLFFTVIFGLTITFLFCLVPVQIISRQSVRVIFMGLSEKISKQRGRKIMLFVQMLVLLVFISSASIVLLQVKKVKENIWHTLTEEDRKNIFCFSYDDRETPGQFDIILQRLKQSSLIDDVFFADFPLYTYGSLFNMTIGQHENQEVREYKVSHNFTDFFHAKMIAGRFWNENEASDAIIVDEAFAALYPDRNPIGMNIEGKIIIGVVENIQMVKENQEFTQVKRPVFYSRIDRIGIGEIYVKTITACRKEAQELIVQIHKEYFPEFSRAHTDFNTNINMNTFIVENMITRFSGICTAICLILCLLSIYSAITMNTEKRRKEVAIRKINGAERKDIILLFSKTYLLLWSVVCLLLFPVIYFAGNMWLETFNQRISLNVVFFSGLYFSVLTLIFFILIFRILEVARCNPAEIVKTE